MTDKLIRYYHTLKYLRQEQVLFRLLFRIKEKTAYYWLPFFRNDKHFCPIIFKTTGLVSAEGKYLGNNKFRFLNVEKDFGEKIHWQYEGKDKLWYLNLHYFDYLLDQSMDSAKKVRLLENYCGEIKSKSIWLEAYPVSLRLVNWILFASKENYSSGEFLDCLRLQTLFLKRNLEYHILANHYLENIVTLIVCAHAFRDEELLDFSLTRFRKELKEQILDDGAHYECSPMYHCIVLSRLLLLADIFRNNKWSKANFSFITAYAEKMLGWLKQFSFADGSYAHFNDSANDIAPSVEVIFRNASLLMMKPDLVPLSDSGYRKLSNDFFEMVVDAGCISPSYQPGHTHSDMLSFCLNIEGRPVFIDPGVSTYETNKQRQVERSTFFHNTVTVNNANQSDVWGSFRVGKRANITLLADEPFCIEAVHDGYLQEYGVVHQRRYELTGKKLHIEDRLIGDKKKPAKNTAYFYLHSAVNIVQARPASFFINDNILLNFTAHTKILVEKVNIPDGFNKFVSTQRLRVEFMTELITQMEIV